MSVDSKDGIIYSITKDWLQKEALERIGRELTEDEISIAKKNIECGLDTSIDTVFTVSIQEAVNLSK